MEKMLKLKYLVFINFIFSLLFIFQKAPSAANDETEALANSYANLVSHYYEEVFIKTRDMVESINAFIANPNQNSLNAAKNKWIEARTIYGITEAFRFYGGPIDGVNKYGEEGPEGMVNAWPLNEAYIDYVEGNPEAGIINNLTYKITSESIISANMSEDDADVSTGWHAIEFLLWGQDSSLETAGIRPAKDYEPINNINNRRRAYLYKVSILLLEHITWLKDQWSDNGEGRKAFLTMPDPGGAILTGIATLAGFELSAERIATALDSGDPEDEHSCFSDQTHNDVRANFNGIKNVYLGSGLNGKTFYPSVSIFVANKNPNLHKTIIKILNNTSASINNITVPFDKMLSEPKNSSGRQAAEKTVSNLLAFAENIIKAGKDLSWNVIIAE